MLTGQFSRRGVIGGLIAAGMVSREVQAAGTCSAFNQFGVQTCTVGLMIPPFSVTPVSSTQEMQNWCWAACISNIFAWHGHPVPQSDIVEKIYGQEVDQAATGEQIFEAINGSWLDADGHPFSAQASPLLDSTYSFNNPLAAAIMSIDLLNNQPLIIGTQGHATVVTAMTYYNAVSGAQQILDLKVRDPWPYNANRRSLTKSEFENAFLVMQVRVN